MASDQRLDSECREHVRKALLKILTRGKDHTPAEVADALSVALPLPSEAPCMNPRCENMCAWPSGSGRPRDFCSRTCRQACYRTLERLRAELDLIETVLARGTATYPERVALSRRRRSFAGGSADTRTCLLIAAIRLAAKPPDSHGCPRARWGPWWRSTVCPPPSRPSWHRPAIRP